MLFHYFCLSDDHGDHGGHAHAAADGTGWQFTAGHTWEMTVPFAAGADDADAGAAAEGAGAPAPARYGYRQRPKVVVDSATGQLTHLLTGVVFDSARPYPSACTKCTGTHCPCDRSWTVLQPLGRAGAA